MFKTQHANPPKKTTPRPRAEPTPSNRHPARLAMMGYREDGTKVDPATAPAETPKTSAKPEPKMSARDAMLKMNAQIFAEGPPPEPNQTHPTAHEQTREALAHR